jgi:glycosyltransferase involved in cell wall biosynthesis
MLISVIIPTFNRASYLPKAVESVISQTYKKWELIIVDDCSTDDSYFSVLPFMKDKRVSYYTLERDSGSFGVSYARNFGIGKSRGEFLAFLDSDDYWLPEKLEKQLDFMVKNCADICQTEEFWLRKGKIVNPRKIHKKISGNIFEKSLLLCIVSPSAVMIKKSVFKEVGCFDENMPACEDYDLWLRTSLRFEFGLLPEKLIVKRGGHDNQLSATPALDKYRIYSLLKIMKECNLSDENKDKLVKVLKKKIRIYLNGCLKRGKKEEAIYYSSILRNISSY